MAGNPGQMAGLKNEYAKIDKQEEGIKEALSQLKDSQAKVKEAGDAQIKNIDKDLSKLHDLLGNPAVPEGQKSQIREQISYLKRAKDSIKSQIKAQLDKISSEIQKLESYLKPLAAAKVQFKTALAAMAAGVVRNPELNGKKA